MEAIKDKVQKLLALAESPNENEAQAAMLKARDLMAKHKLSKADLSGSPKAGVIRFVTGITFSKRRRMWTVQLAGVISRNYCCRFYFHRLPGTQTRTVCLVGFEEDIQVCNHVLHYAMDCIEHWITTARKKHKDDYTAKQMKTLTDSYAYGFIEGVESAFQTQEHENEEYRLVLVIPEEATDIINTMRGERFQNKLPLDARTRQKGYADGARFDPGRSRISSGQTRLPPDR